MAAAQNGNVQQDVNATPGQAANPSPAAVATDSEPVDILRNVQNLLAGGNITGARDQIDAAIRALEAPKARSSARKSARKGASARKSARKGAARKRR